MKGDKLKIIYEPSFIIDNPRILTSLCVFYDEVMLFNHQSIEKEKMKLEELKENNLMNHDDFSRLNFINGPLKILSQENILKVYDTESASKTFEKIDDIEIGVSELKEENGKLLLKFNNLDINRVTNNLAQTVALANRTNTKLVLTDFIRLINVYSVAEVYDIPIFSTGINKKSQVKIDERNYVNLLSENLAIMSICELALPEMITQDPEDILIAREKLKDELLEFKAGILELTYALHERINNDFSYNHLVNECSILVNTRIKSSLMSLESKMRQHKSKKIKNMIFLGTKLILSGGNIFACGKEAKDFIEGGMTFMDTLTSLQSLDKPEHKIASFALRLNKQLRR